MLCSKFGVNLNLYIKRRHVDFMSFKFYWSRKRNKSFSQKVEEYGLKERKYVAKKVVTKEEKRKLKLGF